MVLDYLLQAWHFRPSPVSMFTDGWGFLQSLSLFSIFHRYSKQFFFHFYIVSVWFCRCRTLLRKQFISVNYDSRITCSRKMCIFFTSPILPKCCAFPKSYTLTPFVLSVVYNTAPRADFMSASPKHFFHVRQRKIYGMTCMSQCSN